jgi:DNA processing protein
MSFVHNPSLKSASTLDVLRLIRSENVGPMTFFSLVKYAGSVAKALEVAPELSRQGGRKKPITIASKASAEKELEALTQFGASLVLFGEAEYPKLLQHIPDAPPLITVRGQKHLLSSLPLVAIVGARNASTNGAMFAGTVAKQLGDAGYGCVSGLARGIDGAVHRASLATGTIAVIAGGIDSIYPPEHASLYSDIAERGVIVSEQPFGSTPVARSFPARNRLIAGMSMGTLVVEASLKSGSLITAEYANDYGREVFAVPGSPMDPRCLGTNHLIKTGAVMVENVNDILQSIAHHADRLPFGEAEASEYRPHSTPSDDELASARQQLRSALSPTPTRTEELLASTGISPHVMLALLLEMELAGTVERLPGAKIALVAGSIAA